MPRVSNVDQTAADPPAVAVRHAEGTRAAEGELRPVKDVNNRIEQDHRFSKRRVQPGLGCGSYRTAWWTGQGYEAMNQLRKGQVQGAANGASISQTRFIAVAFGGAA
jgi:transposase-like protein